MINQNSWFSTLLIRQFKYCPPLSKSIECDVLIVGGGQRHERRSRIPPKGLQRRTDRHKYTGSSFIRWTNIENSRDEG